MQTIFEAIGGTYRQEGAYLLPNLTAPERPQIGIWGERRRRYLRDHQSGLYTGMLLGGTLNTDLEKADTAASELFDRLVEQMKRAEGVTEQLKAENQMEWVGRMNSIRSRAEEIVLNILIYN